ncbi:putative Fumarylacetoacetate hydrolase domain-containing protein 2 like protein [Fusarium oxysporum f. sp. albedinis]|nr:putative Fumarylacetoacetate hydrolase domain-containing protein 2 like protein [Fusarium oxysporum f. sp. albedinis]
MGAVVRMHNTLQREYGQQDWRLSLRAGPDCIGILGQCLLITSRSDLLGLKLTGPGLRYTTLFANVSDVAQFGMDTFRWTGEKMALIASSSDQLARRGGIIETMLKFCNPNQDACRDRHLLRYLQRGRKTVNECATAIREINKRFTIWSEMTQDLFKALEEMSAIKASETDAVKSELESNEAKKKLKEEEQAREEARLRERRPELQRSRKKKEWYDNHAAKLATGAGVAEGGLVAVATTTAAAVVSGISIVVGGAAVYLHYSTLRDDLSKMEDELARGETSIKVMTAEAAQLQAALLKLSSEKSSIAQVMKIVQDAVRHVSQLQSRIKSFMEFLEQIASIIDSTVETSEFVHDTAEDTDGMMDPAIKQDLLNNAFDMTTRLTFASRASEIYKTVSAQYIIPTIDGLPDLRLLEAGTDSEINNRLVQLNEMRRDISLGTEQLVMQVRPKSNAASYYASVDPLIIWGYRCDVARFTPQTMLASSC